MILDADSAGRCIPVPKILTTDHVDKHGRLSVKDLQPSGQM